MMLEIYTDGAYSSSRSQGGVGIIILENGKIIKKYSNNYKNCTNNQMECGAIVIALRIINKFYKKVDSIIFYSDSMYCIGTITQNWKRNKNKALWNEFDKQYAIAQTVCSNIQFKHIKGHNGNTYNEQVDVMAVQASQRV